MTPRRFKAWMLPLCAAGLLLAAGMLYHSLSGGQLVGCGAGSGCDSVTGSPWAWTLGGIPISLPALVVWLLLTLCVLFLDPAPTSSSAGSSSSSAGLTGGSLDRLLWPMMAVLAGSLAGAALWFGWLQLGVLHAFCKYCCLLHLLGCAVAAIILIAADVGPEKGAIPGQPHKKTRGRPGKGRVFGTTFLCFAAGLAAAAVFAVVQTRTLPDALYDSGRTEAALPTFADGDLPVLEAALSTPAATDPSSSVGSVSSSAGPTGESLTLLFDFQCIHCRRLHALLPELLERAGGGLRIQLCPVPLSSACNPYIPSSGIDRFAGSCALTRCALAVWYARPDAYAGYWDYLLGDGDEHRQVSPADAENHARELLVEGYDAAMADPRIEACIRRAEELFGRTSSSARSGIPRLIRGQRWLVPEVDDADALLALIRAEL